MFRRAQKGQDLSFTAYEKNAFIDAAIANQGSKSGSGAVRKTQSLNTGIVLIKNESDAVVPRFGVLLLDEPVVLPSADTEEFYSRTIMRGVATTGDTTEKRTVCVLLETLQADEIGSAVVAGYTTAKIDVKAVGDLYCTTDGVSPYLISTSVATGIKIIWVAGGLGTAGETGEQEAVVWIASQFELDIRAKITGSTSIGDNRWSYTFVEQEVERQGLWRDKEDGITGAAYNTIEANNSASGIQGNSSDLDASPGNYSLIPVRGNPVVRVWSETNCDGDREFYFQYENITANDCGS